MELKYRNNVLLRVVDLFSRHELSGLEETIGYLIGLRALVGKREYTVEANCSMIPSRLLFRFAAIGGLAMVTVGGTFSDRPRKTKRLILMNGTIGLNSQSGACAYFP